VLKSLVGSSLEDPTINDVSISVNVWPLSAKLTSFMTRSIVDRLSELVFCKSQIGPGRKIHCHLHILLNIALPFCLLRQCKLDSLLCLAVPEVVFSFPM